MNLRRNEVETPGPRPTVGGRLASRIAQAGTRVFFTVPGDFNLVLLDQLLAQPELQMIGCCNELNAGYAADGYARATGGLGVVVVTYMVGGLSVINAAAGAYSDDLPLLVVSGGPNSLDAAENHRVHHTIGEANLYQCAQCFAPVVTETFVVRHLEDAAAMIDRAVTVCLARRKPVYLEIACNVAGLTLPAPTPITLPPTRAPADPASLDASVTALAARLDAAVRPVLSLTLNEFRRQIQLLIDSRTDLVVETGDSWFNGQKLRLPAGANYHFQMQYGSIGWATGAAQLNLSEGD